MTPITLHEILLTSLWILGFYKAFDTGMIFEKIDQAIQHSGIPDWLYMPLVGCTICMSSLHSLIWFPVFHGLNDWLWFLPFVVCVAGMNTIISELLWRLKKGKEK